MFFMRFAMRTGDAGPASRADLYATTLDMCAWSEMNGGVAAVLSQHHGVPGGYLPSPVPLAAAIAARTTTLRISVAALLLALYEPVKLAEDLAVIDLISRGRVSYVIGIGYREEEFAMFGVDAGRRGPLVEERITQLRRLWAGEEIQIEGRCIRISPLPFTPGGPVLAYGGGSEAAARRAGRLGLLFMAETENSSLQAAYADAARQAGVTRPGCLFPSPGVPLTVFVAEDPEAAWAEIGDYLLRDATSYAEWKARRSGTASVSLATTVAELQAERGAYQIITPGQAASLVARGVPLALQPLVGGLPPDIAWRYLSSAAAAVAQPAGDPPRPQAR